MKSLLFETCSNCGKKIEDEERAVVIDSHNEMIFCGEVCMRENFESEISRLRTEYLSMRGPNDLSENTFDEYKSYLELVLTEPDEVWELPTDEDAPPVSFFIGEFLHKQSPIFYIAAAYYAEDKPSFVYIHFATNDTGLVQQYRRGTLVYDGLENESELEDDEINEDSVAFNIYQEMLDNRSDIDIDFDEFSTYDDLKISTIEKPDEVWKRIDDEGNTFLIYITHYQREQEAVAYIIVAIEDDISDSAVPLFGFPTIDQKLLDRFRVGENLKTDGDDF
jgi:hypothetical protein